MSNEMLIAIVAVTVAVGAIIASFVVANKQTSEARHRSSERAMWDRLDELRKMMEDADTVLRTEYMTQSQIREFFELSTGVWVQKIEHIDSQLLEIKGLLKQVLTKN